jgi:hypothetical protein
MMRAGLREAARMFVEAFEKRRTQKDNASLRNN